MSDLALRYLYETVLAGSMRAAADRLDVAASSISRQITQLELTFGTPLLERGRRTIKLTQAGEIAVEHYRGLMADRETLLMRIGDMRDLRAGQVTFGIGEGFLGPFFTQLVHRFHEDHARIRINSLVANSTAIVRDVLEDEAHFGVVLYTPAEPKIRVRVSVEEPLQALVAPGHPLSQLAQVSFEELSRHPLCLAPEEFLIRRLLREVESRRRTFLEPAIVTNSIQAMRDLAATGDVVTILPGFSARPELAAGRLVAVPLDTAVEPVTLCLITRVGRQLEGAPRRLLQLFEAALRRWSRPAAD